VVFIGASNECWFIWSISSIWFVWLIGLEIHPEEPDRPERPANQTDEPERVARARCASTLREHKRSSVFISSSTPNIYQREWSRWPLTARIERALSECARSASKKGT